MLTNDIWTEIRRFDSCEGNVSKFTFSKDNALVETVLYRYPNYETRTVICCSVMCGCPIGCRFCGSGDYFVRSLTADEIVSEVLKTLQTTNVDPKDIKKLQVMFMSMGEPMLNMKNVLEAIEELHWLLPNADLLLSTVGPDVDYIPLFDLSKKIDKLGLQFSIHESTDAARNELIPFVKKLTLEQIAEVGNHWFEETGRHPFFNYCAHDNNTSVEDVGRLASVFAPEIWNATVSVICERNEGMPTRNDHQRSLAVNFSSALLQAGFNVRVFDPAGQDDIGGGCGQLPHYQQWVKDHASLARPSIGNGKKIVHVPGSLVNIE